MGFAMALSEACQNIVEHAGTSGWVAVQAYTFRRRLGRRVVVIAVSDAGVGFRRSLESTQADASATAGATVAALEAALIQNVSRFRDPGRGQGLAGIKRYLAVAGKDPHPERYRPSRDRAGVGRGRTSGGPPSLLPGSPGADHHSRPGRGAAMIQTIRMGHMLREAVADPVPEPGHPPHRRRGARAGSRRPSPAPTASPPCWTSPRWSWST